LWCSASRCVYVCVCSPCRDLMRGASVSAAKVMRCTQCSLVTFCKVLRLPVVKWLYSSGHSEIALNDGTSLASIPGNAPSKLHNTSKPKRMVEIMCCTFDVCLFVCLCVSERQNIFNAQCPSPASLKKRTVSHNTSKPNRRCGWMPPPAAITHLNIYPRQVNEVNSGDNVFVRSTCVCVFVCLCVRSGLVN